MSKISRTKKEGNVLKGYEKLLREVKDRIHHAQYEALKAVNRELVGLYWDIGGMIVERQKAAGWGKSVVEKLAEDLQCEFPGMRGFSRDNLWRMRKFYLAYKDHEKLAPLVQEIAWAQNIAVMEGCKNDLEREFYIRMTRRMGWSKNTLIRQMEIKAYERMLTSQTNFGKTLPERVKNQARLAVRDEYTFDFLELAEDHREKELERALMKRVNRFLVEMGGAFSFLGNQFRLEIDGAEFFVDILLYHRRLKCLVAVELKAGEFKPEDTGQMQFYLSVLDDRVRLPEEAPSIGIILCRSKRRTVVEYALRASNRAMGVAAYKVVTKVPRFFEKELPTAEQAGLLLNEI